MTTGNGARRLALARAGARRCARGFARGFAAGALVIGTAVSALPAHAQERVQQDLRQSRLRLDSIQAERQRLQTEMEGLKRNVRNASRELLNIERQAAASKSALVEFEHQSLLLADNVAFTQAALDSTHERLEHRTRELSRRIRMIYKRGPLHSVRVLLTSESFGDLMNRYKYLNMVTRAERAMIDDVARLEQNLLKEQVELTATLQSLEALRQEKESEVTALGRVERQRQTTLRDFKQRETKTATRLDQLAKEQARLTDAVAALERRRREAEAASKTTASTLTTRDLGQLNWPVDGRLVYPFGPDPRPNGIVLKNQGIGIGAPAGTPVKTVEAGTVELAGPFPGYGSTVIVSHGGGYRTLYLYLKTIRVTEGQSITSGQVVGTVGGEQTPEGAHLEFQVRVPLRPGQIEAVDPLTWLRTRANR